jgi:hypothetical protein
MDGLPFCLAFEEVGSAGCGVPLGFRRSALFGSRMILREEGSEGLSRFDPELGENLVLTLNQAARKVPGRNVAEPNVAR